MNSGKRRYGLYFVLELLIYGALVFAYLFVVSHFFKDWILRFFQENRQLYALLSLALIVGQGLLLDLLTRSVMNSVHPKWK